MYARRYSNGQEDKASRQLPENYAGNAFREESYQDNEPCEKSTEEKEECACRASESCPRKKEAGALLPFFNSKILSSDTLLLLLAFLLMGNGECDDLPGILIFLLLL